ncbi:MAG TPA: gamma-glutamyl-gamma-aminobutyrate hydrolase family protein, partial [Polyangiaceae bacterium]|nr:gamma-glutamyl-gamma-aminobutyrate hydrolase family protein [Polyangiaceae bacterium]
MKTAVILKHVEYEGPSRIAPRLAERGYQLDIRALYLGDRVPSHLGKDEILVVMGGPMGVGDVDHPEFSFLKREVDLLRSCIEQDQPVLGVCLGSQLLAHAAGARVHQMHDGRTRQYEVGWAAVRFHHETNDEALRGLPLEGRVLHWHGDTFELPAGARHLASSSICPNQAFRLRRQFGLQFHCEVTSADVEAWLAADDGFVPRANGEDAFAQIRHDTARYIRAQDELGDRLFGNILDAM